MPSVAKLVIENVNNDHIESTHRRSGIALHKSYRTIMYVFDSYLYYVRLQCHSLVLLPWDLL